MLIRSFVKGSGERHCWLFQKLGETPKWRRDTFFHFLGEINPAGAQAYHLPPAAITAPLTEDQTRREEGTRGSRKHSDFPFLHSIRVNKTQVVRDAGVRGGPIATGTGVLLPGCRCAKLQTCLGTSLHPGRESFWWELTCVPGVGGAPWEHDWGAPMTGRAWWQLECKDSPNLNICYSPWNKWMR